MIKYFMSCEEIVWAKDFDSAVDGFKKMIDSNLVNIKGREI